jgi:hypothetical protein
MQSLEKIDLAFSAVSVCSTRFKRVLVPMMFLLSASQYSIDEFVCQTRDSSSHYFHQKVIESLLSQQESCGLSKRFCLEPLQLFFCHGPALVFNVADSEKYDCRYGVCIVSKSVFNRTSGIDSQRSSGWILMSSSQVGVSPRLLGTKRLNSRPSSNFRGQISWGSWCRQACISLPKWRE